MRHNLTQRALEWPFVALHCATVSTPGQRIQRARRLRGLRQEDLAELTGVSMRTIGRIEKGDVRDSRNAALLEAYLGIPAGDESNQDAVPTGSRSEVIAWALDAASDLDFVGALARRLSRAAPSAVDLPGELLSFPTDASPDRGETREGAAAGREPSA